MSAGRVVIAHLSDLHFGGYADLAQIEALETFLPTLRPDAVVVAGDLSQRARHGEFQAAHAFVHRLRPQSPVLVVPGNHDIEWWKSPLGLRGERRKYAKYSRYFTRAHAGAGDSRRHSGRRAQQLRRRPRLAHLEPPRRRGEGSSAGARDRPGDRDLREGAARARPRPRLSPQRAARRDVAAHGARQLALGIPAVAGDGRRRDPLRPRSPGGRRPDRGHARGEHLRAHTARARAAVVRRCSTSSPSSRLRCRSSTFAGSSPAARFRREMRSPSREAGRPRSRSRWRAETRVCERRSRRTAPRPPRRPGAPRPTRGHPHEPHGDGEHVVARRPAAASGLRLRARRRAPGHRPLSRPATPSRRCGAWRSASSSPFRWISTRRPAEPRRRAASPGRSSAAPPAGPGVRAVQPRALRRSAGPAADPALGPHAHSAGRAERGPPDRARRSRSRSAGGTSPGIPGRRSSTPCCTRWCTSGRPRPACRWITDRTSVKRHDWSASFQVPNGPSREPRGGGPNGFRRRTICGAAATLPVLSARRPLLSRAPNWPARIASGACFL